MTNLSLQYSLEKIGLPLIVTSSKPNLCFLIDTGATHNIVFSYVYEEFQHLFSATQTHSDSMMGIDGIKKETIQVTTTLYFNKTDISATFSVLDATEAVVQVYKESGIQIHGILGVPFLTQNKWILNFNKLTLQC
ncbi:MAG: hypothetical protein NC111_05905 [Bacteroides sp.]|nr:hypothetical protein [Bacteroides sp.]MCM1412719.1 hypothetical protein [Bacteroides sp.]MCM1472042.1 hypothetical protein [Bacteroides sp.]